MRRFWQGVKTVFLGLLGLGCCFALTLVTHAPLFEQGISYVYYLGKSSTALMVRTDSPLLTKLTLPQIQGESTLYLGDCHEELLQVFEARVLFCEYAAGVENFYCHSPKIGDGVFLSGVEVNLHIALSDEYTAVGSPLIFGGF